MNTCNINHSFRFQEKKFEPGQGFESGGPRFEFSLKI